MDIQQITTKKIDCHQACAMSATMQMNKHITIKTKMAVTGSQSVGPDTGFYVEVSDTCLSIVADTSQVVQMQEMRRTQQPSP
jgi:hypothetical protein